MTATPSDGMRWQDRDPRQGSGWQPSVSITEVGTGQWGPDRVALYFSKTLVPRIFWLLKVPRNAGTTRSINSKYDESAGVS